jgi:hypothetical protein
MKTQTKALMITAQPGEQHGLDELNLALSRGWRVSHMTGMGGAGFGGNGNGSTPDLCFAALVVIERDANNHPVETQLSQMHKGEHEELLIKEIAKKFTSDAGEFMHRTPSVRY